MDYFSTSSEIRVNLNLTTIKATQIRTFDGIPYNYNLVITRPNTDQVKITLFDVNELTSELGHLLIACSQGTGMKFLHFGVHICWGMLYQLAHEKVMIKKTIQIYGSYDGVIPTPTEKVFYEEW